jgi:hypothetical protein
MEVFLTGLNQHAGALNLIFSAIVAISTVVYALLTWRLVSETRLVRRAQTMPKIAVYYRTRDEWMALLDIIVRNIGLGPAYDVQFDLQPVTTGPGTEQLMKELRERNIFSTGLRFLAPTQEYSSFFTNVTEQFDEKMAAQIRVTVRYVDSARVAHIDEYTIDLSELRGMVRIGEPPLLKIAKQIEKMAQELTHLAGGQRRLQADVYTVADRTAEREKRTAQLEEMRRERAQAERLPSSET